MLLVAVPGHHIFNKLQAHPLAVLFHFIPKLMARHVCLRGVKVRLKGVEMFQAGSVLVPPFSFS